MRRDCCNPTSPGDNGLIRSKGQAVINIAVIKGDKTVTADVDGSVADLTGRKKELSFRPVSENGSVNYIAQFAVEPDSSATYVFTINVKAGDGDTHTLSFNQQIFSTNDEFHPARTGQPQRRQT